MDKKILIIPVILIYSFLNFYEADAHTPGIDHVDIVASIKADLVNKGFNLSGAYGAFQITDRVAWELQGEGVGIFDKPGGNNCMGYSTDLVIYPDRHYFDLLGDGGGANNPIWLLRGLANPDQWRPPIDPAQLPANEPPSNCGDGGSGGGGGGGSGGGSSGGGGNIEKPTIQQSEFFTVPSAAKPGQTVQIYGSNLGGAVQLISLADKSITHLTASLDEEKTKATFTLPLGLAPGDYSVLNATETGPMYSQNILTVSSLAQVQNQPQTKEPQNFGDLVESLVRWAMSLVGAAIFFAFLYAGFLWLTAAGRSGQITKAREIMTNALIGAIVLLASYLILKTINPDLIGNTFKLPGL